MKKYLFGKFKALDMKSLLYLIVSAPSQNS